MVDVEPDPVLTRVAQWCGLSLTAEMLAQFDTLAQWLQGEAVASGGLGPHESDRVMVRHIADSLTFAQPLVAHFATTLVDLGSGVGLPGIPLAIAFPAIAVTLVDRGGRRTDLARRAARVVGIDNVTVVQGEVGRAVGTFDAVTMRAVLPPEQAIPVVRGWLASDGLGVVGLSHGGRVPDLATDSPALGVVEVPTDVLDSPGWLLTIRP